MQPEAFFITGIQAILTDRIQPDCWLLIADGQIRARGQGVPPETEIWGINPANCRRVDYPGYLLAPGFIDLHTHGAGGGDFMDGTPDAWQAATRTHARHGTTALLATTLASSPDELAQALEIWRQWPSLLQANDGPPGSAILGLHLEGPYFSLEQRGAQDPRFIRNPDPAEYSRIIRENPGILRWSAAPELPGAMAFGQYAAARGILVSMAHSNALYPDVLAAMNSGYSLVTHLYSAMSGVTRVNGLRRAGMIESALLLDDLSVEIIADGCHLPAELLQLIFRCKGASRIALVTDSMRAAGQSVTDSILGSRQNGLPVIIQDSVARLPDGSALAGSIATTDRLLRTMNQVAGIGLPETVTMLTHTPARLLGLQNRKGSLEPGMDADLVVLDQDLQVVQTYIGGKPVIF